jgi:hypothetical protein
MDALKMNGLKEVGPEKHPWRPFASTFTDTGKLVVVR